MNFLAMHQFFFSITVENEKMQKFLDELEDEYKKLEFPKNDFKIDDLFDE